MYKPQTNQLAQLRWYNSNMQPTRKVLAAAASGGLNVYKSGPKTH